MCYCSDAMDQENYHHVGIMLPRMTKAVKIIIIATVAAFVVQRLGRSVLGGMAFYSALGKHLGTRWHFDTIFGLSIDVVMKLRLWQIVTYMFLHAGVWHIFVNMLLLFFLGPEIERAVGTRRFFVLYFVSGMLGGIGWLLCSGFSPAALCIGASGATLAILGAFAALYPRRQLTLLLFFVFPVRMTARTMAILAGMMALLPLLWPGMGGNVAHAAHLVGGIAGYLFAPRMAGSTFRRERDHSFGYDHSGFAPNPFHSVLKRPRTWFAGVNKWRQRRQRHTRSSCRIPSEAEINGVLEKMQKKGFYSLTRQDRDILYRASKGE